MPFKPCNYVVTLNTNLIKNAHVSSPYKCSCGILINQKCYSTCGLAKSEITEKVSTLRLKGYSAIESLMLNTTQ